MTKYLRTGNAWRTLKDEWVRSGGVWRQVKNGWLRTGNTWRLYSTQPPGPFYFTSIGWNTYTIPTNLSSQYNRLYVKLWGAGGGAGYQDAGGGAGGYIKATFTVTPGETLNIFVPAGGEGSASPRVGGAGGSFAAIFRGTTPLVIAGGAGGAGAGRATTGGQGGGGGGTTANSGAQGTVRDGTGGSQTAGGIGGVGDSAYGGNGALYFGGDGGSSSGIGQGYNNLHLLLGGSAGFAGNRSIQASDRAGGGGAGAGFYGGGGGGNGGNGNNAGGGGGGGGSSFYGNGATLVTQVIGSNGNYGNNSLPYTSDVDYINDVGVGRGANQTVRGGQGLVVLRFIDA